MGTKHIIPGLIIAAMIFAGCYRKQETVTPVFPEAGGKGGRNKVRVTVKHFEQTVDTAWVFVRYDATAKPLSTDWKFNDSLEVIPQNGTYQAVFDSLKPGNYYFYARGYDFNLMDTLSGGMHLKVAPDKPVDTAKGRTYETYIDVRTRDGK